jgi:hypothetical protein
VLIILFIAHTILQVLQQIISLSTLSYNLQGSIMEPEVTNHPAFAIWLPIYAPSAEQDTEYNVDGSENSPMQHHQELPEEYEHSSTISCHFLPRNHSTLSLNMSINDSGIFLSEPDKPTASNMRKKCAPWVTVSQRYANVLQPFVK